MIHVICSSSCYIEDWLLTEFQSETFITKDGYTKHGILAGLGSTRNEREFLMFCGVEMEKLVGFLGITEAFNLGNTFRQRGIINIITDLKGIGSDRIMINV